MTRLFHKTILIVLVLAVTWTPVFFPTHSASAAAGLGNPAEVEAFFDGAMAAEMSARHIPGAVVSVVEDGQVLFSKGYGFADLENQTSVDPQHTLFRAGSVAKLFGATAVMQLAEQGKLDLDADVNTYLDFKIPTTCPQAITLKNLLTHTAGFEDIGQDLFKLKAEEMQTLGQYLKTHIPARVFSPGKLGAYSNYGAALAAYIVERVSGLPFTEYVEKNIFTPLGMSHATFLQPLPADLQGDLSSGYNFVSGEYIKGSFEFVGPYPAGSLSVTGADMTRFMIAHLQNGRYEQTQILSEASAKQMHSLLFQHDPRLEGMAYGFFSSKINGQRVLSHTGDTFLFHSGLFLIPEQNVGVFISTNAVRGEITSGIIFKLFMDHYYPSATQPVSTPGADFSARMALYLGEYYPARSNFSTFEKLLTLFNPTSVHLSRNGRLLITTYGVTNQAAEVEPGLFQLINKPESRLVFKTDDLGQAYLLTNQPFALVKTPWYGTSAFHKLVAAGGMLLFLGSLIGWPIAFFAGLRKREKRQLLPELARWIAALFGIALLVLLFTLVSLITNNLPAFGVPHLYFENPPSLGLLMAIPPVMVILAGLMALFMLISWVRRFWTAAARIHYTLLTLSAAALIWALIYWKMLF